MPPRVRHILAFARRHPFRAAILFVVAGLAIATLALMARSYKQMDVIAVSIGEQVLNGKPRPRYGMVASRLGSLTIGSVAWGFAKDPENERDLFSSGPAVDRWLNSDRDFNFLGFCGGFNWIQGDYVGIPLWLIGGVLLVLEFFLARRWLWRLNDPHACPACGYDTRGTPGRCPECGWTASSG